MSPKRYGFDSEGPMINIFESPWETYDEQEREFPKWAARQTQVMYDILPDGSFVSVGKPHITIAKESTERVRHYSNGNFTCVCGNYGSIHSTFYRCNSEGVTEYPLLNNEFIRCIKCYRIFNAKSLRVVGQLDTDMFGKVVMNKISAEKIKTDRMGWMCICGNQPDYQGFYPSDEQGNELDPDGPFGKDWQQLWTCDRCGRIINDKTLKVVGQTEKGRDKETGQHRLFDPLYDPTKRRPQRKLKQ